MTVGTKEFYDIIENFEKIFYHMRLDKEERSFWAIGQVYQDGETNKIYSAFRHGYSLGRANYMNE